MTLPSIGTTLGAQAANQSIQATSDANGNISFVGPSGIQGSTVTCVATVPMAPAGASFVGILGTASGAGVTVDTWGGNSTAGQFQMLVGQTLVVTGTRLAPNTQYTCTFATITDVGDVQVVIPDPNSSALSSTLAGIGPLGTTGGLNSLIVNVTPAGDVQFGMGQTGQIATLWNWFVVATSISAAASGSALLIQGPLSEDYVDQIAYGSDLASTRLQGLQSQGGVFDSYTVLNSFETGGMTACFVYSTVET